MRLTFAAAFIALLAAMPAAATDVSSTKDKPGGSSASGAASSSGNTLGLSNTGSANPTTLGNLSADSDFGLLRSLQEPGNGKWWSLDLTAELHRLFIQSDLEGQAPDKLFLYYQLRANLDLTRYDRFFVRAGMYERFLADQTENGVRASDLRFGYTRTIPLPWQVNMQITGYLTAPTSFDSYLASNITTPSLGLILSKTLFGFTLEFEGVGHYYWDKYTTYSGGNNTNNPNTGGADNTQFDVGLLVDLEYAFPWDFLKGLSIGIDFGTDWYWYYGIYPNNDPYATATGIIPPVAFGSAQPVQQDYSDEIYVRYSTPKFSGFSADITLAVANGDPGMGSPQILHGGVDSFYLFWRQNSEIYLATTIHY